MNRVTLTRENLSTQLYDRLRTDIMNGRYRPGERLTIAGVAQQFGTSSTPAREAIFRLASEKALEFKAATSVQIPELSTDGLREIVKIRIALEGLAAGQAAQRVTSRDIADLEALHAKFIEASSSDPEVASRRNRAFHFKVLKLSDMSYVEAICENMWVLMGPFLRIFHEVVPRRDLTADRHLHHDIIKAMKAGDSEMAAAAMQKDVMWSNSVLDVIDSQKS